MRLFRGARRFGDRVRTLRSIHVQHNIRERRVSISAISVVRNWLVELGAGAWCRKGDL